MTQNALKHLYSGKVRDLYEVSRPEMDDLVRDLRRDGALGARMIGGTRHASASKCITPKWSRNANPIQPTQPTSKGSLTGNRCATPQINTAPNIVFAIAKIHSLGLAAYLPCAKTLGDIPGHASQ